MHRKPESMFVTTSQTPFLSEILADGPIPEGKLAYFRTKLSNTFYDLVLSEFAKQTEAGKITKADLARRIGCKPEQITRRLSAPGNWTLSTVSDLMIGLRCEPLISVTVLANASTAHQGA